MRITTGLGFAGMLASAAVGAETLDYSGGVVLASDYVFRGISQTDEEFAIQGTLNVEHESGLYVGVWASNVDFNDGDEAGSEVDAYVGFKGKLTEKLSYDLNFLYFLYPGADSSLDYDYYEITPGLSYDAGPFAIGGKVSYSPEFFADSGTGLYYQGAVDVPLPAKFAVSVHGGYQTIDDNAKFGTPDYKDWSVTLKREVLSFNAAVAYVDTDLEEDECFAGTDLCDARAVFSIGKDL